MVKLFSGLKKAFSNTKTRMILIIMIMILVIAVIVVVYRFFHSTALDGGKASISSIPANIQSRPTLNRQSNEYMQKLLAANQQAADSAMKTGQSEIPTLVTTPSVTASSSFNAQAQTQQCLPCCSGRSAGNTSSVNDAGGEISALERSGKITPILAGQLKQLQSEGVTPQEYAAKLRQLVAEGKLTPAEAKALENAYRKNYTGDASATSASPDGEVDQLLSSGDINAATAKALKALNAQGLTPAEYAKKLQQMVREGKLSPAAAQALEAAYEKAHSRAKKPNAVVDRLLASGAISPQTARELKALNAKNLTPEEYAARLKKMVAEGKLTPAEAARLLAAYKAAHHSTETPDDIADQLAANGSITPETARELKSLNAQELTPDQYAARLKKMVAEGKLTPAQARRLLAAYNATHGGGDASTTSPNELVGQMEKSGAISPQTANDLKSLNAKGLTPAEYAKRLNEMVKEGKLTPAQAKALLSAYQKHYNRLTHASPDGVVDALEQSGALTPQLARQLQQLNTSDMTPQQYEAALKKMVAEGKLTPEQAKLLMKAYDRAHESGAGAKASGQLQSLEDAQDQAAVQQENQDFTQQQQQLDQAAAQQQQAELTALQSAIGGQASKLFTSWNSTKQSLAGAFSEPENKKAGEGNGGKQGPQYHKPVVRAGSVLFAVLDTAINSDQPGPVMATIVTGKYKGAKLMGGLNLTNDQEAVTLSFNKMMMPQWPGAASISAVAINPDTARTALSSHVNHHYLLRYGSVFASSFFQGLGNAIQQSGQTNINNSGTTTTTFDKLNTGDQVLVGLGQVGQSLSDSANKIFNRPYTVTVKSGTGLGILFRSDVTVPTTQSVAEDQADASSSANQSAPGGSASDGSSGSQEQSFSGQAPSQMSNFSSAGAGDNSSIK